MLRIPVKNNVMNSSCRNIWRFKWERRKFAYTGHYCNTTSEIIEFCCSESLDCGSAGLRCCFVMMVVIGVLGKPIISILKV
jgi:hypothetical protein